MNGLAERFRARFGGVPRVYRAPGRVNVIGEHTDYNDGFVLPAALEASCWVAAAPRSNRTVVIVSEDIGDETAIDLDDAVAAPRADWTDYPRGIVALLRRAHGDAVLGASLLVRSDVPLGSGLSSSAAFETAVALALLHASGLTMSRVDLARLCQRAENDFAGARCGIMDPFVASEARAGHALVLDCRSLAHRHVPLPRGVCLVACNTMVRHAIASGEYNRRREECEAAVSALASRIPGVRALRDVTLDDLERHRDALTEVQWRRSRHVVSENARVQAFAEALARDDMRTCGELMAASHLSLRDDYEVSCPELDLMVEIASAASGVLGARMTGGGFGGCTVNLVSADAVDDMRRQVASAYFAATGREPSIVVSAAGGGAARVE